MASTRSPPVRSASRCLWAVALILPTIAPAPPPAVVFQDGLAFKASWRSDTRRDTPRFFDEAGGAESPLRAGQSWSSVVPLDFELSYEGGTDVEAR